jgi:hypothetical protein
MARITASRHRIGNPYCIIVRAVNANPRTVDYTDVILINVSSYLTESYFFVDGKELWDGSVVVTQCLQVCL